jgi:hypothetical protein
MGCFLQVPNNTQQQEGKIILAGGFNIEFQEEQVNQYLRSDVEDQRRSHGSEVSVHSGNLKAMLEDVPLRPIWQLNQGNLSQDSYILRSEPVNFQTLATTSSLSADYNRLSANTYSQIHHRRISSRFSEPRVEHSYLLRQNDASYVVATGKRRDMPSLLAAIKKKTTLTKNFKGPEVGSPKQFCSDTEMNLSDMPSDTVDDQLPQILMPWKTRDMPSMLASSKKKPTHMHPLRRSWKSSQKLLSSDSEMNWSDIQSETVDDQPQSRYVLRPSINQLSQSSPKSQFHPQHTIDESGTHSPPSVLLNNHTGWPEFPAVTARASTIWPQVHNGCLSTVSVKLTGLDAEPLNELPEKRTSICMGLTAYDKISLHLSPLLNEDGHASPHLTEGSSHLPSCRSQTIPNQPQQKIDCGANINSSQIDEISVHLKEHGGNRNILICMK